jgi:hypothetical protein
MGYVKGRVLAICDRCGFQFPLSELRKEWTGLMVCRKDYDPRPPEMKTPNVRPEGIAKPNSRPDNQDDETPNTTTPDDL